jgi:AraC-like DNA-binding protein
MATVFSTRGVHPRDRLGYWLEVATKAFVRHEFTSPSGASFIGVIRSGSLAGLGVSLFDCDPCEVARTARDIARDESDDVLLCLQVAGRGILDQDGRQAVNEPGSIVLVDTRRPYSSVFPGPARAITFKIERRQLESRLGSLASVTARALGAEAPAAGLASGFLSMLARRFDALAGPAGAQLAEQALDLIALAFAGDAAETGFPSAVRAAALLRLKSVIETRLCDPDLKPAAAAACARMSVRYANALLSQEGFSIERYILHRRLERCRRALEDSAQAHRMIGEIAFGWGFSDLSHFARRFRAAYGLRPSECRQRAFECAHSAAGPREGTSTTERRRPAPGA